MTGSDWGIYYGSINDNTTEPVQGFPTVSISTSNLTMANALSLYLYGQLTPPENPADRIRPIDSPHVQVTVDMNQYMQGPGTLLRPAAAYQDTHISKFFEGEFDAKILQQPFIGTTVSLSTRGEKRTLPVFTDC